MADEDLFMTEPAGGDWAADQAAGAQAHEATLSGSPLAGDHPEPETSLNAESDGGLLGIGPLLHLNTPERLDAHAVVEPLHAGPASQTQSLAMAETPVAVSELKPEPEPTEEMGATRPLAAAEPAALRPPASEPVPEPASEGPPQPEPQPVPAVEEDYLQGVEQLLAEWRARHELSVVRGSPAAARPAARPCPNGTSEPPVPDAPAEEPAPFAETVTSPVIAEPSLPAAPPVFTEPPVTHRAAALSSARTPLSLSVFDAAEYEIGAADLAAHAILLDPLGVVILDMVDGAGSLSAAELKRLEVFRSDRIELAATTLELPPRLRSDEDVVLRLAQIQLYAAALELRSKWSGKTFGRGDRPLDAPYSARDFKLKIARDIMDLPASDRSEVIGYALGELLTDQDSTTELKRAVIDTLENLHSAVLANVLLDCLDDPDVIVQEYALAAADRLLDS